MKYIFLQRKKLLLKYGIPGNSLVVQWLGLSAVTARAWIQSPVRELRSRFPCGVTKLKKKKKVEPIFADRLDEGHKRGEEARMTPRFVPLRRMDFPLICSPIYF